MWHVQIPYRLVLAREIITGSTRSLANTYALPKRRYLGPTSMDHELSFVMCNLGHVKKGSLVYDPFAGVLLAPLACEQYIELCRHELMRPISSINRL